MNKSDIKQYLKTIYSLPVQNVNTQVIDGERFHILEYDKSPDTYQIPIGTKVHTNPHRKIAYVTFNYAGKLYEDLGYTAQVMEKMRERQRYDKDLTMEEKQLDMKDEAEAEDD